MEARDAYAPPETDSAASATFDRQYTDKLIRAQKLVIWAIVIQFVAQGLTVIGGADYPILGMAAMPVSLVGLIMSLWGVIRMGSGLGSNGFVIFLLVVLMFLPLINLITLVVLNGRVTRRLRAAGYRVGLMGVPGRQWRPSVT